MAACLVVKAQRTALPLAKRGISALSSVLGQNGMRLFTALELPDELIWKLDRLLCNLRPEAMIKWSPLDNLHITTKFIGEWPKERVPELEAALRQLCGRERFTVRIERLGWFPNPRFPKVLWAGVDAPEGLPQLVQDIETCLEPIGIAREDREFNPHLTLARIKGVPALQNLRCKVEELQGIQIGSFAASAFHLYRSDPGSQSSIYSKMLSFSFEGEKS